MRLRLLLALLLLAPTLLRAAGPGVVVASEKQAAAAGAEILRRGGNAVDAAVATGLALAVTYPRAGNLGGGGFLLVRLADGRSVAIDFRETAPAAASRGMYLDAAGNLVPGRSTQGHLAAGVPGTVAGFALALDRFGSAKVTWADIVEPARRLAAEGFPVSPYLARDFRASEKRLSLFPEARRLYLRDCHYFEAGETWKQPELAATLARLQREGPREFYEGETARLLAADQAKHGGLITLDDLRAYKPKERAPLRGRYRGAEILTMPLPSSGGIALLQMLTMLEEHDVPKMDPAGTPKIHLFVEVMRRAFRDRAEFLGDSDHFPVPLGGLLDPSYARGRMRDFDPARATPSAKLPAGEPRREGIETTHFSVVDAAGNAASCTYTLNDLYGSGVVVPGAGFLLNDEMDDFAAKPGSPNMFGLIQGEANAVAPGKRPLSSMTPTIVVRDGKPLLVTGSPGGPTIITTVLHVLVNVLDHGMTPEDAVAAPRFHHQWMPDEIHAEDGFPADAVAAELESMGHKLSRRRTYTSSETRAAPVRLGDAETIYIDPKTGTPRGIPDKRSPDSAAVPAEREPRRN